MVVFVDLGILHFELGDIVSRFVFVRFQVKLNNWAIPDGESLSFFHFLKYSGFDYVVLQGLMRLLLRFDFFGLFRQDVSSP